VTSDEQNYGKPRLVTCHLTLDTAFKCPCPRLVKAPAATLSPWTDVYPHLRLDTGDKSENPGGVNSE
jgi:hypothetical protein